MSLFNLSLPQKIYLITTIAVLGIIALMFFFFFLLLIFSQHDALFGEFILNSLSTLEIDLIITLAIITVFVRCMVRVLMRPIYQLKEALSKIEQGEDNINIVVSNKDEIGDISRLIARLLQDRTSALNDAEREIESLHTSITDLNRAFHKITRKDFSVRVTVKNDITRGLAEDLNFIAQKSARMGGQLVTSSKDLKNGVVAVKQGVNDFSSLTNNNLAAMKGAVHELDHVTETMSDISRFSEQSDALVEEILNSASSTDVFSNRVLGGVKNMNDSLYEAERKVKRLGEYAQTISMVVNSINNISERAQILALNSNMYTTSSGESGSHFSLMADEMNRLSDTSRETMAEISTLANNVQLEIMNITKIISELTRKFTDNTHSIEGLQIEAGNIQQGMTNLKKVSKNISSHSIIHVNHGKQLRIRARKLEDYMGDTESYLEQQSQYIDELVHHISVLNDIVASFN